MVWIGATAPARLGNFSRSSSTPLFSLRIGKVFGLPILAPLFPLFNSPRRAACLHFVRKSRQCDVRFVGCCSPCMGLICNSSWSRSAIFSHGNASEIGAPQQRMRKVFFFSLSFFLFRSNSRTLLVFWAGAGTGCFSLMVDWVCVWLGRRTRGRKPRTRSKRPAQMNRNRASRGDPNFVLDPEINPGDWGLSPPAPPTLSLLLLFLSLLPDDASLPNPSREC